MEKHDIVLESLYRRMQDDLDDGMRMYWEAIKMKEHDEKEMARFTMADAKSRMEHADIIKDKIENYKKANDMTGSSEYKTFYCYAVENIEELKMKISKFTV